jgi:hypothetical protein
LLPKKVEEIICGIDSGLNNKAELRQTPPRMGH